LERKQERRGEVKGAMRIGITSSKAEQWRDTIVTTAMTSSLAKKARSASTVDSSRTCSNRRSGEDECGNDAL